MEWCQNRLGDLADLWLQSQEDLSPVILSVSSSVAGVHTDPGHLGLPLSVSDRCAMLFFPAAYHGKTHKRDYSDSCRLGLFLRWLGSRCHPMTLAATSPCWLGYFWIMTRRVKENGGEKSQWEDWPFSSRSTGDTGDRQGEENKRSLKTHKVDVREKKKLSDNEVTITYIVYLLLIALSFPMTTGIPHCLREAFSKCPSDWQLQQQSAICSSAQGPQRGLENNGGGWDLDQESKHGAIWCAESSR